MRRFSSRTARRRITRTRRASRRRGWSRTSRSAMRSRPGLPRPDRRLKGRHGANREQDGVRGEDRRRANGHVPLRRRRGGRARDRRPPRRGRDRRAWRRRRLARPPAARGGGRSGAARGAGRQARRRGRVAPRVREARADRGGRARGGGVVGVEAVLHEPRLRRGGGDDLRGDGPRRGRGLRARSRGANRDREVAALRARRRDRRVPRLEVADRPPHAARTCAGISWCQTPRPVPGTAWHAGARTGAGGGARRARRNVPPWPLQSSPRRRGRSRRDSRRWCSTSSPTWSSSAGSRATRSTPTGRTCFSSGIYLAERGKGATEVERADISEFLADLALGRPENGDEPARPPCSPATISRKTACLRSFYRHLRREELIDADPTATLDPPQKSRKLPNVLSHGEVTKLLDSAKGARSDGPARPGAPRGDVRLRVARVGGGRARADGRRS